jgi:hypothetical protein
VVDEELDEATHESQTVDDEQVEQATEVEVYTGREIVQGQSVIVRVVADATV